MATITPHSDTGTSTKGSPHTFHIPVMGTGFTIDTPLKVAKYGISSVISIGDDILIEQMRKLHAEKNGIEFEPIDERDEDCRARRITAYLNLMNTIVSRQIEEVRSAPFEVGSDITRYFEMLPESPSKESYRAMLATSDPDKKKQYQNELRQEIVAGSIDANVMTKVDFAVVKHGQELPPEFTVVMSAMRGFAKSDLASSIVLSAGMNRRLFGYMTKFEDFLPDAEGNLRKKIILKVSDFRSAQVQGKLLARKGLWVSEYRIESGLNCGGHAFATKGHLMGPILDEFKEKKGKMIDSLHGDYLEALAGTGHAAQDVPNNVRITVQGGIGVALEDAFLLKYYEVDGTGWGTPFLLVPEATNVDDAHLEKLAGATDRDVRLGGASPLGVPFWSLNNSSSEETRRRRIAEGKPGSPCPKGYLKSNTEYTKHPICTASRAYQKRKLEDLSTIADLSPEKREEAREKVLAKLCICFDLAGGAILKNHLDTKADSAVCCGPGMADFSAITSLEKMIDHIYGRWSLMTNSERQHMFVRELNLYVEFLRQELEKSSKEIADKTTKYFGEFKENLVSGIEYYRGLAENFGQEQKEKFLSDLDRICTDLEGMLSDSVAKASA